jgi:hypothetical protein
MSSIIVAGDTSGSVTLQAPYVQVAELVEKIKAQAVPQVEALPKEEVAE